MTRQLLNVCSLDETTIQTMKKKRWNKHKTKKRYSKTSEQNKKYINKLIDAKKKTQIIPLKIIQVWHDKNNIPKSVKESIELIKEQNPEFKYKLFEENEWEKFIKNNYSKRILDAYHSVVPYAIKADLFRYCYLYKNGGIYLDSKYYGINGFKFILLTDKEYFCKDVATSFNGIYNAIIICKPKNKILLRAINECVKNIENEYYGGTGHCPTGPLMLKQLFTINKIRNLELTHEYVNKSTRFVLFNKHRILKYHEDYKKENEQKFDHWSFYWKNKTMYK